jgi:hypothetical protein
MANVRPDLGIERRGIRVADRVRVKQDIGDHRCAGGRVEDLGFENRVAEVYVDI